MKTLKEIQGDIFYFFTESQELRSYTSEQKSLISSYKDLFTRIYDEDNTEPSDYLLEEISLKVKDNNFYLSWFDGCNSGFVDIYEDLERDIYCLDCMMFFETEEEAENYKKDMIERGCKSDLQVCSIEDLF